MSEVYKSTTHGPIPLSFEGRRLMQNMRFAAMDAIDSGDWHTNDNALSKSRGDIAEYISVLEAKVARQKEQLNGQFGEMLIAEKAQPQNVYQLPKIPKGYELHIVNGLVSISPIIKVS